MLIAAAALFLFNSKFLLKTYLAGWIYTVLLLLLLGFYNKFTGLPSMAVWSLLMKAELNLMRND